MITDEPILEIAGLEVDFSGFKAVDGFDLTVTRGELRVLIGANGAGKTTLMDLISGKTRSTAGRVRFKGCDITNLPEHVIARGGVGRKFQIPGLFRELSVIDNLEVAANRPLDVLRNVFLRLDGRRRDPRIGEVLAIIGLGDMQDAVAGTLSHGQMQWLELGMVLVQNPDLILLDEPTAGMTSQETDKTAEIITGLGGNHTLVVVEHDMGFVRSISNVITVMHQGRKLAEGTVAEIENDPAVIEAYLGSGGLGHA